MVGQGGLAILTDSFPGSHTKRQLNNSDAQLYEVLFVSKRLFNECLAKAFLLMTRKCRQCLVNIIDV